MINTADDSGLVRFLDLIKPFVPLLPEVAAPERKVPFQQRLMWTGVGENIPTEIVLTNTRYS